MINVDTVYQRVLVLANKEQRGYITPQEFNLLANQAQMEIFEQYFYDINQADRQLKNATEVSNPVEMLEEKIAPFKAVSSTLSTTATGVSLPFDLYRIGLVMSGNGVTEVEMVSETEMVYILKSPLTKPTTSYPAYTRETATTLRVEPILSDITCNYIRKPSRVQWAYIVVNEKALYNNAISVNFELHASEESELVYKILELAGIVINKPGLAQLAGQATAKQVQSEKQ